MDLHQPLLAKYQRLIEISKELTSTLDIDILLDRIVNVAAELSNASHASILLFDDVKCELYFRAATNVGAIRGLIVPVENSIAGWIVTNSEPLRVKNVHSDERYFGKIEETVNIPTTSLLGVPLITKDKVIGVLEAISKIDGDFTLEDQEIMMALGTQAAVAIENSRLFLQLDLIDEFIHEIRTPLSSITTSAQLLSYPQITQERQHKISDVIITESARLLDMTKSFLDLAQLESGRYRFDFRKMNLHQLLEECANLVDPTAAEAGIRLKKQYSTDLPEIIGDFQKLKQSVINLLNNAIKYNKPNGEVLLQASSEGEAIKITIQDTGIGIPKSLQANLFQKFYRIPGSENISPGTGLGLSIVKRIVEGHQGEIAVMSKLGKGTAFTISLPIS